MENEKKQFWKTKYELLKAKPLGFVLNYSETNPNVTGNDRFVFSVQWQFLPDKFQTADEPLVDAVVWYKVNPNMKPDFIEVVKPNENGN